MCSSDLGIPIAVALNKADLAEKTGVRLDVPALEAALGAPCTPVRADRGKGLVLLKHALRNPGRLAACPLPWRDGAEEGADDQEARRRTWARRVAAKAARRPEEEGLAATDRADRMLLHPIWGGIVFAALMFGVFWALFSWATIPMDAIEAAVGWLGERVGGLAPEGLGREFLRDGLIGGVGSVLVFAPQIALFFALIAILEASGYMARAAFLMDRVMAAAGLSGRAFIPLLGCHACAIPGIMGARALGSARERLIVALVGPWMSCSARLPVYALLITVIFGAGAAWWVRPTALFALYAMGALSGLALARLLRRRLGGGAPEAFLLELPPYRWPRPREVARQVWESLQDFLKTAGTVILILSMVIWAMQAFPRAPEARNETERIERSWMGRAGKAIEPAAALAGWDWRTASSIVWSFAAREVFVSSMAILFPTERGAALKAAPGPDADPEDPEDPERLAARVSTARRADGRPVLTTLSALSMLVFYVYALQCLATVAVVRRETGSWGWALGQFFAMSALAYAAAVAVYQTGRALGWG